jgi:UDP-glucose 4-epimerase
MLRAAWRWRLSSFPAPELDHVRFVCMVDDRRAREQMGWAPSRSLRECALALDDR